MTADEWNEPAKNDMRLLPTYGQIQKTEGQKNAGKVLLKLLLSDILQKEKPHSIDGFSS
jgi:hypothetical protein